MDEPTHVVMSPITSIIEGSVTIKSPMSASPKHVEDSIINPLSEKSAEACEEQLDGIGAAKIIEQKDVIMKEGPSQLGSTGFEASVEDDVSLMFLNRNVCYLVICTKLMLPHCNQFHSPT
jgi:hypothetical protein